MSTINTYQTSQEIDSWLEENGNFEDVYVLEMTSDPFTLLVGYTTLGNYRAYSDHHIQPFRIIPNGIIEISPLSTISPSERNCHEAIEVLETDIGVGIRLLSSPYFDIVAESFIIKKEPLIKTTFKPYVSLSDISAHFSSKQIPTPAFWKEQFQKLGCDIAFRYYGGTEAKELPLTHYHGYFIQSQELIKDTLMGIFISFVDINEETVSIAFEKRDDDIQNKDLQAKFDNLWDSLTESIFSLPNVKVQSGNCLFTANQWEDFASLKNQND